MPSTPLFFKCNKQKEQHYHPTRLMTTPLEQRYDLKPGRCPSTKTVHRLKDPEPKRPSITLAHQKPPVGGRSPPDAKSRRLLLDEMEHRQYRCQTNGCGRSFTRKEHLTRHERSHNAANLHTCHVCHRKFNRRCAPSGILFSNSGA